MKKITLILAFIALTICTANSASDEAILQITGYSTTPSAIYPGTTGNLQITLNNAGSETASSITIYSDYGLNDNGEGQTTIGDIGAQSMTIASIPFKAPSNMASGIMQIHLTIYYGYGSGKSKSGKLSTTISVPLSQRQILEAKTVSMDKTSITPGDSLNVEIKLENTGGIANNVVIKCPEDSSFMLDGTSQQSIGNIAQGSSNEISLEVRSLSSAKVGKYAIPIIIEYLDGAQNIVSQTAYIGPISVNEASSKFDILLEPLDNVEVGSEAQFNLIVENRGSSDASLIIDINKSSIFTPLGNSRIYIDNILPKKKETRKIKLGVDPSSAGGYYIIQLDVKSDGSSYSQNMGVEVRAGNEIRVITETEPTSINPGSRGVKVIAQIANTGNTPIRSVYATAIQNENFEISGTADKFVGTLNVDDFTTFQFSINIPGRLQPGEYSLPIKITFKDGVNAPHTIEKEIVLKIGSALDSTGVDTSSTTSGTMASRRGQGNLLDQFGLPGLLGLGLAALAVGYFGYKKFLTGAKK